MFDYHAMFNFDYMIEAQEMAKRFRSRAGVVEAVRRVDIEVRPGEIVGFLGPNGAGKTTTLRMLTTLLAPDAGEAKVAGHDLRREPVAVRRRIGYVPQARQYHAPGPGRRGARRPRPPARPLESGG